MFFGAAHQTYSPARQRQRHIFGNHETAVRYAKFDAFAQIVKTGKDDFVDLIRRKSIFFVPVHHLIRIVFPADAQIDFPFQFFRDIRVNIEKLRQHRGDIAAAVRKPLLIDDRVPLHDG